MERELTTITVNFTRDGLHRWPGATPHRGYLAVTHRHLFHVTVEIEVHHDDREIEFHDLLDCARELWPAPDGTLEGMSCEAIARHYIDELTHRYGDRWVKVAVFEDGEVGATVTRSPLGV